MRRALFFIVAISFAATSFASIPRASMHDRASEDASASAAPLSETRVWASDVLAPFERPAESELTRALRQAYANLSTTDASGLGRFLSVDPDGWDLRRPQSWNGYSYVLNNPINSTDPTGRCVWDICVGEATAAVVVFTTATAYVLAPSSVPGKSNGDVMVESAVDGFKSAGRWLLNGNTGGGGDQMAAETSVQNWAKNEQAQQDSAPTTDPKRRFSKADRDAGLDKSKDAEGTPRCEYCGNELNPNSGSGNSYEGDHRTPHAQGGRSTQDNLAPSCRDCNREKGNRTPEQWKKDKEKEQ